MEWNEIKQSGDIFKVKDYLNNHQDGENLEEAKAVYNDLRQKLLAEMKADPTCIRKEIVERYFKDGIFTREELIGEGLATYNTLDALFGRENTVPNLEGFTANPCFEAKEGCTDVYFLGIPNVGTTCLLMGLTKAEGFDFTLNYLEKGGHYAAALRQYAEVGVLPNATPGKFITTINGTIEEKRNKRRKFHHVNFVEMSGEEFVHDVVNSDRLIMAKVGAGVNNLLRNANRKVFFILVDPTADTLKFDYYRDVFDQDCNIINMERVTENINQQECLSRFVDRLAAYENREFMKNVDAVHLIVTKADTLGKTQEERNKNAYELLVNRYAGLVKRLCGLCCKAKINRTTEGKPCIFTFSLGKFYASNVFEYASKDSLYLIDALRHMTQGTKQTALRSLLGMSPATMKPLPGDYGAKIDFEG